MNKQQRYKYLSKSILLEESGLPHIHTITILSVTAIIALFIIWANFMVVNDTITVNGYAEKDYFSDYGFEFVALVPSDEISAIHYHDEIKLSVSGITNKNTIPGLISEINEKPISDKGRIYYQITVEPVHSEQLMSDLKPMLYDKMETRVEVIVGSRTLLQYFLGPLWDASRNTSY